MKPFRIVAEPHKDILEGNLTMDVFAASLWKVFRGKAPEEYQDPNIFFKKTFDTQGLKNILETAKKRIDGKGGDPVIQLETPFGGGKTHTLIYLYHKAKEMGANVVVVEGTALDPDAVIWEEIERQLTGKVEKLKGMVSPGKEKIEDLLEDNQPVLILMDELLQYATRASGIMVGDSNLSSQLLAFMQALTEAISSVRNAALILTLPSSSMEHFDENAEMLFKQLKKVTGRMDKINTPVQVEEIYDVIRRRLFSYVDKDKVSEIVDDFIDYGEREDIFPKMIEISDYRQKFNKSYPFQPEVIDVLYRRWGTFPDFQRTRGVLRLLSLVVESLKDSKNPFIRLSDFDLSNENIKRELIRYIGPEYDAIIVNDITSTDSGAKFIDKDIGSANAPFLFGTRVATAIFLYSFSGGYSDEENPDGEKGVGMIGASLRDIKLSCAEAKEDIPSNIIEVVISRLNDNLFYIHNRDKRYFFRNQPNLNSIHLNKKESIEDRKVKMEEKDLLNEILGSKLFEVFKWPYNSNDIPDTKRLKLVVLENIDNANELAENYGNRPRVYKNTLIFLAPTDFERSSFEDFIKGKIAWELINNDKILVLTSEQRKEVNENVKNAEKRVKEYLRDLYRIILLPTREGFKEIDLGKHSHSPDVKIDYEIQSRLRNDGEIPKSLAPLTISERYLKNKQYVETNNLIESFYKTPGEIRISSDKILKDAIIDGVKQEFFGFGRLDDDDNIKCTIYGEKCTPYLVEKEIIINSDTCKLQKEEEERRRKAEEEARKTGQDTGTTDPESGEDAPEGPEKPQTPESPGTQTSLDEYTEIELETNVPFGKVSNMIGVVNYIKSQFDDVNINIEFDISAKSGEINKSDYEIKIQEALDQMGIKPKKENLK